MTLGHDRARRELERLHHADPDGFEILDEPQVVDGRLRAEISIRIGPLETAEGGLDLREREDFILFIPADFPFAYPSIRVSHKRFASFPHVIWAKTICLYPSAVHWNPGDGLYGFFDRLRSWLGRAAVNNMDPVEGPLEPPHHVTDSSLPPFVIRCNAPVAPGQFWLGLAELEKHANRIELVAWHDPSKDWPEGRTSALAIILPEPLPMEFPEKGREFFHELMQQGVEREQIIRWLALASLFASDGEPIYLVLGLPMRRAADGSPRLHIAVWTTDPACTNALCLVLGEDTDTQRIRTLRQDVADGLASIFEDTTISWCRVFEDRSEIVVRRDARSPVAWFAGKKVAILGCGALGSWCAEIVARAGPTLIHLVDNALVKPGLLARQNYGLEDIGANKAVALYSRIAAIAVRTDVVPFPSDAHAFAVEDMDRFRSYDIVLDCTASAILQMKLERDWFRFERRTPVLLAMAIDGTARHSLAVVVASNSVGGIWDAFLHLKRKLCFDEGCQRIVSAFYSIQAVETLFQPEPGCSDPTFTGSTADATILAGTALNLGVNHLTRGHAPFGIAFSAHEQVGSQPLFTTATVPETDEITVGPYRVRIARNVYREVRTWVRHNNRVRSSAHETGGLLWGHWDDAVGVVWIFDVSGPPRDSKHDPGHFVCGTHGTVEEHNRRCERSHGICSFIGFWHTHPDMPADQSLTDISAMAALVSGFRHNQRRALMVIFGRAAGHPRLGVYAYESQSRAGTQEFVTVGAAQIRLEIEVV
ncbi:MAG TPA: ThiF family adenylyltransferase [Gemmataceae bacterium]|nr:ThiF family adenylyltransferase [Pirellulales bacterium]HZZ78451.1 ThiF family adenylyltransferase [Gemmataceae bacterium]